MIQSKLVICVAVLAVLAYAYGPIWPVTSEELKREYSDRKVLVCGASYGIGKDLAIELAASGAHITLAARSLDKLEAVAAECRERGAASVHIHATDLSSKHNSQTLVEFATEAMGGIDVLILNHIIGSYGNWVDQIMSGHESKDKEQLISDLDFVDKQFAVNTLSYIHLSSFALPVLSKSNYSGSRIIVVGSMAGVIGFPRVAPYAATKSALFGYFDALRQDMITASDVSLRKVGITTGVLGSFGTEKAQELIDEEVKNSGFVKFSDPRIAALDLLTAGARGWQTVYTPWGQTRLVTLLYPFMPSILSRLVTYAITGL